MINITIIGFGNVGKTLALLLLNNKHALRINIMEPNDNSIGAFLDLNHGLPLFDKKELQINEAGAAKGRDGIFQALKNHHTPRINTKHTQ